MGAAAPNLSPFVRPDPVNIMAGSNTEIKKRDLHLSLDFCLIWIVIKDRILWLVVKVCHSPVSNEVSTYKLCEVLQCVGGISRSLLD